MRGVPIWGPIGGDPPPSRLPGGPREGNFYFFIFIFFYFFMFLIISLVFQPRDQNVLTVQWFFGPGPEKCRRDNGLARDRHEKCQ